MDKNIIISVNDLKQVNIKASLRDLIRHSLEVYEDDKFLGEFEMHSFTIYFYKFLKVLFGNFNLDYSTSAINFAGTLTDVKIHSVEYKGELSPNLSGGFTSQFYLRIQIDSTGATDTFRWSVNDGTTWEETYIPITAGYIVRESANWRIVLSFENTTGHILNSYYRVNTLILTVISTTEYTYNTINSNAGSGVDYFGLVVGTSNKLSEVFDTRLYSRITHSTSGLQYGAISISTPIYDANSGLITITRSYTNASAGTYSIREIGLIGEGANSTYQHRTLFARDNVNIDLLPTKVLNLTYNLRVQMASNGGFTKNFVEALYQYLSRAGIRTYQNIDGGNINLSDIANKFALTFWNPHSRIRSTAYYVNVQGYNGIVVGTGTTAPNINDYKLENIILSGMESNRLQYFSTGLDRFLTYDFVNKKVSFKIRAMFLNKSGSNINVSEVGLYSQGDGAGNTMCIGRWVLATPVSVSNNQALLVELTITS